MIRSRCCHRTVETTLNVIAEAQTAIEGQTHRMKDLVGMYRFITWLDGTPLAGELELYQEGCPAYHLFGMKFNSL